MLSLKIIILIINDYKGGTPLANHLPFCVAYRICTLTILLVESGRHLFNNYSPQGSSESSEGRWCTTIHWHYGS